MYGNTIIGLNSNSYHQKWFLVNSNSRSRNLSDFVEDYVLPASPTDLRVTVWKFKARKFSGPDDINVKMLKCVKESEKTLS